MKDNILNANQILSYLSALEKGTVKWLIHEGWLNSDEINWMQIILEKLGCVEKKCTNWISITDHGLDILSYFENSFHDLRILKIVDEIVETCAKVNFQEEIIVSFTDMRARAIKYL